VPIFEFTCQKCRHQFEELLSLAELGRGEVYCPACGSKRLERGFSAFATGQASSGPSAGPGGGCGSGGGCGPGGFT
jgi:putative FmdB family regulatory protein